MSGLDMDALAAKARARRESFGGNVRFINADGVEACFSWRDAESANRFRADLRRRGMEVLS